MGAPGLATWVGANVILEPGRKGNSTITFNFNIDDADARVCLLPSLAAATVRVQLLRL